MSLRYLFGPVDPEFADRCLGPDRRTGRCLAFGPAPGTDLTVGPRDTWDAIAARLPGGRLPDFVALRLDYTHIPGGCWDAPVPVVGLAGDWNLLWHRYRHCLGRCELVLTDRAGVERLTAAGFGHTRYANLYGCRSADAEGAWPDGPRDVDVLFVGNMQDAVQRERLPWLARLAALGERWNVVIRTATYGDAHRQLLARARIVFNRSIRGECNMRTFEAACAGALLFQEADNREVPDHFADRREFVAYTDDDLEPLLEFYLTHETERRAIADAARAKVREYRFADLWGRAVAEIEPELPALCARATRRPPRGRREELLDRLWQDLCSVPRYDADLARELTAAAAADPTDAALHSALGLLAGAGAGDDRTRAGAAVEHFRRAVARTPDDVLARLNLAETLAAAGRTAEAIAECRRALGDLEEPGALARGNLALPHHPARYDFFRVEWERAAWANAGDRAGEARAKRAVLAWRLHGLAARLTGALAHRYEAAMARPDLPATRAALAAALVRDGKPAEAAAHLRYALAANPFDRASARALFDALGALGRPDERERLVRARRLLAKAAPQVVPPEPWFTESSAPAVAERRPTPSAGAGLASLVVLCCNELRYTQLCLDSVLRHTRRPYELILVDNASTDGTPAYLDGLRTAPGPERVVIVRNETNLGFTAGSNQGIARSAGRYVVLLNNDTVVTSGWLDGLIDRLERHGPRAGLIGPMSNATAAPQQIPVDYSDLSGLETFADRLERQHGPKTEIVSRLAGFCLVVRREALEAVGGLDERYGVGFFDDFDLCVRAREAGFDLLMAPGVFVHHFLGRTFAGQGIDVAKQFQSNFDRFLEKWGRDRVERYLPDMRARLPAPDSGPALAARPRERPRVSLCMIVRNEEKNLPDCLAGAADLVDERVIVDTGSTDATRAIATRFGARIVDFPWADSFAAARNESLRHATGDWIFWLDADDRLDDAARTALRTTFAALTPRPAAYLMRCAMRHGTDARLVIDHVRLFRNDPAVRWEYRVHEQILPAAQRAGWPVRRAPVVIRHEGYVDPAVHRAKAERNLRLLLLDRAERPDDPLVLFNLGSLYLDTGRTAEAVPLLERSIGVAPAGYSLACKSHVLLVCAHRQLGRADEALRVCRAGRGRMPREPELLFYEGLLLQESGEPAGAEKCFRELLALPPPADLAGNDVGLGGYKTRHNLALALRDQGRTAEAEAEWRGAIAECPDFAPAWLALAAAFAAQERWADLEQEAARARADPRTHDMADALHGRLLLARKEHAEARRLLGAAADRCPHALWPRLLLAESHWQEDRASGETERALRAVLALDPNHLPTRNRLAQLANAARESRSAADPAPEPRAEVAAAVEERGGA